MNKWSNLQIQVCKFTPKRFIGLVHRIFSTKYLEVKNCPRIKISTRFSKNEGQVISQWNSAL
jgi:hypothetical protein